MASLTKSRAGMAAPARAALAAFTALAALLPASTARAAELKVLTAGAYKPVLAELQGGFEQRTGHRLRVEIDTAGALQRRINGGEAFDVIVLTQAGLDALVQSGKLAAGSSTPLARVGIGVAVKQGTPVPDIGSVEAFRRAVTNAKGIATVDPASGGTSGIYLWQLFEQWGIATPMRAKATMVSGGLAAQKLLSGEADIALQQMSELLVVPGVTIVGPLPAAIQRFTVYSGAVSPASTQAAAARALVADLASARAPAVLKAKGMEAP